MRLLGYHWEEIISVWHSACRGSRPVGGSQSHCLNAEGGGSSDMQGRAGRRRGEGRDGETEMDG